MTAATTPPLDSNVRAELREAFDHFDLNRDGRLQRHEFVQFMRELDPNMRAEETHIGFDEIDSDRDHLIAFEEFVRWWTSP